MSLEISKALTQVLFSENTGNLPCKSVHLHSCYLLVSQSQSRLFLDPSVFFRADSLAKTMGPILLMIKFVYGVLWFVNNIVCLNLKF